MRALRGDKSGVPELHPIAVKSPWYMIGIDFIDPISPESEDGSRYILTISDYFTKWVEALPTLDKYASMWQSNGYDCGLFALANATALCDGTDPSTLSFDQSKLRQHFLACIEKNNLQPFPVRGQRRIIQPPRIQKVEVFCVCRLPDDGSEMIQCCQCQEWFHTSCIRVPRACLKNPNIPWLCTSCK